MEEDVLLTVKGSSTKGISRRNFLRSVGFLAAAMSIPKDSLLAAFTQSLAKTPRLPVVWLEFQDCTGESESFLRGGERTDLAATSLTDPGIVDLLLSVISLEYHETIMAPSGAAADKSRLDVISKYKGKYLAVVEGSIPTGANGAYCTIGGRTALSIAQETLFNAGAVAAVGSCSVSGCLPTAYPNPTGAKGVLEAFPTLPNVINLPGCPANVVNVVSSFVYFISYGRWPSLDSSRRPVFAYGKTVHDQCPREEYFEDGPHVRAWGDAAHRAGGCLVRMGCRGPVTHSNCPKAKWNGGTCWPVESGHGCIGCAEPKFWDRQFPYYSKPLPADD